MGERADYLRTSTVLCAEYPLTGSGWGGFFRTHMKIKFSDVQETARDPHNVVALFASQCGIPAGLIMLWVLLCPLIFLWKHRFEKNLCGAVFWCGVIFTLHSLIDCDWQIPALIVIMGVLYTAALAQLPEKKYAKIPSWVITAAAIIISVGAWATTLWYIAGDVAITNLQDKVNPASLEMAHLSFPREKRSLQTILILILITHSFTCLQDPTVAVNPLLRVQLACALL